MEADERRKWTLLSSHGHVLVEIARNPRARVRDISAIIGITERATQAIIADLERAGYVERVRIGRRTHYVLHPDSPFRHSAQDGLQVGPFLDLLTATNEIGGPMEPMEPMGPMEPMEPMGPMEPMEPIAPSPAETFLAAAGAVAAAGLGPGAGVGPDTVSAEATAEAIPLGSLSLLPPVMPPATEGGAGPAAMGPTPPELPSLPNVPDLPDLPDPGLG